MRPPSVLTAAALLMFLGCKASPGDPCNAPAPDCLSPSSRLTCQGGKYAVEQCKGPKGCAVAGGAVTCDVSRADLGDACLYERAGACSVDANMKLRCEGGKFVLVSRCAPVDGKGGCGLDAMGNASCGSPYSNEGDACTAGTGACDVDHKYELRCKDGKMTKLWECRGEEACAPHTGLPVCDRSIAQVGEPCSDQDETATACTAGYDAMLVCKGGKYVTGRKCAGPQKCNVNRFAQDARRHFEPQCDQKLASIGDDCTTEGGLACAEDHKSRLKCTSGKFALDQPCKKGCEIDVVGEPFKCTNK